MFALQTSDWVDNEDSSDERTLAELWDDLVAGRARVRGSYASDARQYLEVEAASARALTNSQVALLERLLLGQPMKVIAFEAERALSSVSAQVQQITAGLGFQGGVRALPAALFGLVLCVKGRTRAADLDWRLSAAPEDGVRIYSMSRCDLVLPKSLARSECQVLRRLLDGSSYATIGRERGRSERTIANQLASVYRKLGVSGRTELLGHLLQRGRPV
jgi:DNA-binding NarL/FixJ family response regulator